MIVLPRYNTNYPLWYPFTHKLQGSRPFAHGSQGKCVLLHPAPPCYPFHRGKSISNVWVNHRVVLWAGMVAATMGNVWIFTVG